LLKSGFASPRALPVSDHLRTAYATARRIWKAGGVEGEGRNLAMNFAMDRSDANWRRTLAEAAAKSGTCDLDAAIVPTGRLSGRFSWNCANGKIEGSLLLAPTADPQIQSLAFQSVAKP
jgi:hypothetical protein